MPTPPRTPRVTARLLRPLDLLDAQVTVVGATVVRAGEGAPQLRVDPGGATLTLHLAFQHLGEEAWPEFSGSPAPGSTSRHRAARASRLVYDVPAGTKIEWSTAGLLAAVSTLRLKVVPLAVPGPDAYPEDESPATSRGGGRGRPPWLVTAEPGWQRRLGAVAFGDGVASAADSTSRAVERSGVLVDAQGIRLIRGVLGGAPLRELGGSTTIPAAAGRPIVVGPLTPPVTDPPIVVGPLTPPVTDPPIVIPPILLRGRPRAPEPGESAIEAPYRVIVSPSAEFGAFAHAVAPAAAPQDPTRVQLWHTRLVTRIEDDAGDFAGLSEQPDQRVVRAVWTRDLDPADAASTSDVFLQSLYPKHRRALVRQSAARNTGITPLPLRVRRFYLTALGAWIDWHGKWDPLPYIPLPDPGDLTADLESYRHLASMGRDAYVRVTEPGFLFPFGHRAVWVTVTERKLTDTATGGSVAHLRQRYFIVVREPTRAWADADTPLRQVTVAPLVTPDLDPPPGFPGQPPDNQTPNIGAPFVPARGGTPLAWDLTAVDQAGETVTLSTPLMFVSSGAMSTHPPATISSLWAGSGHANIAAAGQSVSFAPSATHGDTRLEVNSLRYDGRVDVPAFTARPVLTRANAVVPSLRHLAPQAPGVDVEFAPAFLTDAAAGGSDGFGPGNPGQLFLRLTGAPIALDYGAATDSSGGFIAPSMAVRALSRTLGAVGEDGSTPGGLQQGRFDAKTFLDGALPKLFGLFSLVDILALVGVDLDKAPTFVTEALDTISQILTEAERLRGALSGADARFVADLATAAHDGARAAIEDVRAAVESVRTVLEPLLDTLTTTLGALAGNPAGVDDAQSAIEAVAQRIDDLQGVLTHPRLPAAMRAELEVPAAALGTLVQAAGTVQAIVDFARNLLSPGGSVTARFEWRPEIGNWAPVRGQAPVFIANDPRGLSLAVTVRAGAQADPVVDVTAELREFSLQLLPGAPLMRMDFSRIGFRTGSRTKPQVDVVFDGMEFLGELGFIETLRRMIPFDGFADPPYVDVSPSGVTAGFDLALPNVAVGVFSLENLSLGADARVPFLGDAVTVGFRFCSKDSPFRLTVMCIGGGGWVSLRAAPTGMVELEMGLEAGASLSVDFGVASGSVSITVGVYLRLEGTAGSFTAYFRIRGEVDVLGLITASITLELSLTYDFDTGKLIGRASIVVEVEVLFFSASVEISCERQLAGSKGDPVLADIMPPDANGDSAAWSTYCTAFAPGAVA